MRTPISVLLCIAVASLSAAAAAQAPRGGVIPLGARVKAERRSGGAVEGVVLRHAADTLTLRADAPDNLRGDTLHLTVSGLKGVRVVESPPMWRRTAAADIGFFQYALIPQVATTGPGRTDRYAYVLLIADAGALTALDAVTGDSLWSRIDAANLAPAALDVVGQTGYGIITQGPRMEVFDLRTGQRRWETGAIGLLAAHGWLPVPGSDTLIVVLGRSNAGPSTLLAVDLGSGVVRWRQDSLFALAPRVFSAADVSYLLGHQPLIADSDTTLILYLSAEGPIRLDARTGARLWRADALRGAPPPATQDGFARMRRRDSVLFVPSQKRLLALRTADGQPAWGAPRVFRNEVVRMEWTRHGLLVRGDDWLDLVDPGTGQSVWRAPLRVRATTRLAVDRDTVYYAMDKTLHMIDVASGTSRQLGRVTFDGGEGAVGIAVFDEGIVLSSWHNVSLVDRAGSERYHSAYPSPKESFGERFRAGMGTATTRPTTRWHGGYLYFFTAALDDAGREGFSVVKLDPTTGRESGRVWLEQRSPDYLVEWESATVHVQRGSRDLVAMTFGDWTAFADAARNGNDVTIERLLAIGADPTAASKSGWTALHRAARNGHTAVVRRLLDAGVDARATTDDGWTAWMLAAREGHDDVAQVLSDAGGAGSPAAAAFVRGWHHAVRGAISDAIAAYAEGDSLDSTLAIAPAAWEALCWYGALAAHAAEVMPACDRAVAALPAPRRVDDDPRLARGIARAMMADYAGALADLEAVLDPSLEAADGYLLPEWIATLRQGRSPFGPAQIADLRRP